MANIVNLPTFPGSDQYFIIPRYVNNKLTTPADLEVTGNHIVDGNQTVTGTTTTSNAATFTGTVTTTSVTVGTSTVDTSNTSASVSLPYNIGSIKEIFWTNFANANSFTLNDGSAGANLTIDSNIADNPFLRMYQSVGPFNGDFVKYNGPTLQVGVYMLEYGIVTNQGGSIIQTSFKVTGSGIGSNTVLRNFDSFEPSADLMYNPMRDYFTVTTANPITIIWSANGHNGSSTNYYVILGAPVRITKIR